MTHNILGIQIDSPHIWDLGLAMNNCRENFTFLYESLTRYAHDIIFLVDGNLKIVAGNDQAVATYGYSEKELLALHVDDFHTPGTIALAKSNIKKLRSGVTGLIYETIHKKKDGTEFPVEISAHCVEIEGTVFYQCVIRDITERKEAAEKILKLNLDLEKRVVERTGQLESANRRLEDANKELEAFSYSVSHDLRAPLRSIEGFGRALVDDHAEKLDKKGRDYLNRVVVSAAKMSQLIDDMLKLSHITRSEIRFEPVDLSAIAESIARELKESQPGRDVTVRIARGVTARGDAALLRIALENLFRNAWKFTGKKDGAVIEFGIDDKEGSAAFFVRDNGAGFDMRFAGKLFGAFQRFHAPEEFPGSGIGLATVHRIIRRHGGRIWAESGVGKGTTFYFRLESA